MFFCLCVSPACQPRHTNHATPTPPHQPRHTSPVHQPRPPTHAPSRPPTLPANPACRPRRTAPRTSHATPTSLARSAHQPRFTKPTRQPRYTNPATQSCPPVPPHQPRTLALSASPAPHAYHATPTPPHQPRTPTPHANHATPTLPHHFCAKLLVMWRGKVEGVRKCMLLCVSRCLIWKNAASLKELRHLSNGYPTKRAFSQERYDVGEEWAGLASRKM